METTKVQVIIEQGKDGKFSAYMDNCDFDFGLAGFGNTAKEAVKDFYEAYEEEKAMSAKENKSIPALEFDIKYDVCAFLDYYSGILSKSGLEKITGINQKQLWHYSSGLRRPKANTTRKIQERVRHFADDLRQVQLVD